ncbi:MAG: hypothetical protein WCW17_04020 [Patescibacteria group bacterium]|jgi:DNA-binding transcriptional regulator PaaX
MTSKTKEKAKNFTIDLIDLFLSIPETVIYAFDRKEFYRILQGRPTGKELTCSNISRIIADLKKRKYIEVQEKNNGESIIFTDKAKLAAIDKLIEKNNPDNKFRFVSFDIPEIKRINRDRFRRAIKNMGFVQIQKSLWATDKNVGNFVDMAANEYEVNKYVVYMVTELTNIDLFLQNLFKKFILKNNSKKYKRKL